ncbi:MAG: thiamine pyrophosphate-dependent enzyme, partial [Candidatus Gracilibacteria bacterium]
VPTVYITGQVTEELIGTDAFQETDVIGMSMPVVKHSYFVNHAVDIPRVLKEAFYIASTGRPGPVHVDLAKNAWLTKATPDPDPKMDLPGYNPIPQISSDSEIKKIEQFLSKNNLKPLIIAGHGVELSRAEKELFEFAKHHDIPVVNTLLGLGTFPQGHDLWCGMMGMHGDAVANYAVAEADLIIGVGIRFDDRITGKLSEFIKNKTFIHIEIDPSEVNKNVPVALALYGDAAYILARAIALTDRHTFPSWRSRIAELKTKFGFLDFTLNPVHDSKFLSQPRLVKMISDATDGEAIVASDVGRHQMWTGRFYRFKHPNSHLSSGGLGSMGYGLPAAMGAAFGAPDREIWSISGDGGFMMNVQEMATVSEHHLPIRIVIMEDNSLGMVRQWQNLLFGGNISHSDLKNPDFVKLAEAFGIKAFRATTEAQAAQAITEARKVKGPALINFKVDPDEHVFPMVISGTALHEQALGDQDFKKTNDPNKPL